MSIQVPIDFLAKFDKALDEFEKFNKRAEQKTKSTGKALGNLEKAAKAFIAAFTVNKIIDGLQSVTEKAVEAEEASRLLVTALVATGDATSRNVQAFQNLADELSATSRYDDELILSQVAVAKQFGTTNAEAAKLIRVAVNLSAATGDDLNTSVRNLGMTLDGTAGRMANQFPILQKLTAAQLRNGEAIDILGKMYAGSGSKSLEGFRGQQVKLTKGFDNMLESIGMVITRNPLVIESMGNLAAKFVTLTDIILTNGNTLSSWLTKTIAGTKALAGIGLGLFTKDLNFIMQSIKQYDIDVNGAVKVNDLFGGSMDKLSQRFDPVTGKFTKYKSSIKEATRETGSFNYVTGKLASGFDEAGNKFNRFASEVKKDIEDLQKKLQDVGKTELDGLNNEYRRSFNLIEKARVEGFLTRKTETELLGKLEMKYVREAGELKKKQFSELTQKIREAYENPIQTGVNLYRGGSPGTGPFSESTNQIIGAGLGGLSSGLQGEEGARKLLSAGIGAIASIWLGPLGSIVGEIVGELSKGPEHVKAMLTQFFDALPQMIDNIVAAGDEALITILEKFPDMVERMIDRLPDMLERFFENLPRIAEAFVKYFIAWFYKLPGKFIEMLAHMVGSAGKFVGKILEGAFKFVGKIIEGAGRFIDELVKGIGKAISKSVGGGINLGGGSNFDWTGGWADGDVTSIATGGLSDLMGWKAQGKGSAKPMVVQLQVGGKQLAQAIVDLRQMGHKV